MSNEMTDAEYAEYKRMHKALQDEYKKDPEGTLQAVKDALQLPSKSGDLND